MAKIKINFSVKKIEEGGVEISVPMDMYFRETESNLDIYMLEETFCRWRDQCDRMRALLKVVNMFGGQLKNLYYAQKKVIVEVDFCNGQQRDEFLESMDVMVKSATT